MDENCGPDVMLIMPQWMDNATLAKCSSTPFSSSLMADECHWYSYATRTTIYLWRIKNPCLYTCWIVSNQISIKLALNASTLSCLKIVSLKCLKFPPQMSTTAGEARPPLHWLLPLFTICLPDFCQKSFVLCCTTASLKGSIQLRDACEQRVWRGDVEEATR